MSEHSITHRETFTQKLMAAAAGRWQGYRAWRQRRRDLADLRALGAAGLRDLGIDLSECTSIVETGGRDRRRGYNG